MSQLRLIHEAIKSLHDERLKERRKTRGPLRIPSRLRPVHEFVKYFHDVVHPEIRREEIMERNAHKIKPHQEAL
jgi:hypothetical protein